MENGLSEDEKLMESKIKNLQEDLQNENISFEYKKMPYEKISEYQIKLSFLSLNDNNKESIQFILFINIIKRKIYLYALNLIELSDGRDLLPFINQTMKNKFNIESINLLNILKNIKIFLEKLSEIDLSKVGRFYLGEIYDINLISNLQNIYSVRCYHCDIIDGNYINIPSLVTISEDYFCLYEYGQTSNKYLKDRKNKFTLIFYGNVKSILSFKKSLVGSIVTIAFRKDLNNKEFYLKINGEDEDMDKIMDILIDKIKKIGYRMNIYEKKQGKLPEIDVSDTEKNISIYEEKLKEEGNVNVLKKLLEYYEKAIEYYSAINDERYIEYNNKVRKILKNEKYFKFLE